MTGPEIVEFSKAINLAYDYDELKKLLLTLDRRIQDYVPANAVFPTQVDELVGRADSQGWISQLVLAVLKDRPNKQSIKDFLSRRPYWDPAKHPPAAHPSYTLRVFGGFCFIGRSVLRSAVRKMEDPTDRKVLVITSTHRKVGKTYSKELVDFISQNTPLTEMAYVDLDSETYTPFKLAKKLAREMRLDPNPIPEETTEQAARANQELVSLLIRRWTNPPKVWWIVLDGFRDQIPSEAIQDFIAQLAQRIQRTQEFRLVLVNYSYSLPLAVDGFSFKEELQPLTPAELETHFISVHRQKHNNNNPSPQQLADYLKGMKDVIAKLRQKYQGTVDDQTLINIAVMTVADTIEETP